MQTIIYIIGQSYCGSTMLGMAMANHQNVKMLGETENWIWGRFGVDAQRNPVAGSFVIDLMKAPNEAYCIDTSKSIWRHKTWTNTKYDVKTIWLKRSLRGCIKSRLKRSPSDRMRGILKPVVYRLMNYLYLLGKDHITVKLDHLQENRWETQRLIEKYVGTRLTRLYGDFDMRDHGVICGNIPLLGKKVKQRLRRD